MSACQRFQCSVYLAAILLTLAVTTGQIQSAAAQAPAAGTASPSGSASDESTAPSADQFATLLEQWKSVLQNLRDLQKRYPNAGPSELSGMQLEFEQLMQQGNDLLSDLRTAAVSETVIYQE